MMKLFAVAAILAGGYLYLAQTNPRMLHQMHLSGGSGGGSLNPVMGGAVGGSVGAAAVSAAGRIGG